MENFKVAVIGIWHLGAVTSACLADLGYDVVGIDPDTQRVDRLNRGIPPLYEPGLEDLVRKNLSVGRLSYTTGVKIGLQGARYVIIAFDTPVDDNDQVDLSPIRDALSQAIPYFEDNCVIIVTSQVPIGSCEEFATMVSVGMPSLRFDLAYVPENLKLGQAVDRFKHPDMIVIGTNKPDIHERVEDLYSVIDTPKVRVNLRTAEMVKHGINAYLAMQISFINEIANLCDRLGADAVQVGEAMRLDSRIGPKAMLKPGLGFAGGTLARDLKTLQGLGQEVGYETHIVNSILRVNKSQNRMIVTRLKKVYGSIDGLMIGVLGLTYKPGTSTLRRSASLEIIDELNREGAKVKAYDPKADLDEIKTSLKFEFCEEPIATADDADALILVTAWPQFKDMDFSRIRSLMKKPVIIDAQNMLDGNQLAELGFTYLGVGRGRSIEGGEE